MNENVPNKFDPFAILDEARLQRQLNSITGGGSALTLTDGTNTVDDVAMLSITGGTIGGVSPNATLTVTAGLIPATSNLTWYVATTGSDSNPGTMAQPFATIQHAVIVAAGYDYQTLYFPTVDVADGTYTLTNNIILSELTNVNGGSGFINGNLSTPANCILFDSTGAGVWFAAGSLSIWYIQGFETDSHGVHYNCVGLAQITVGTNVFADRDSGDPVFYNALFGAVLSDDGSSFTVTAPSPFAFASANYYTTLNLTGTYTLPITMSVSNFLLIIDAAFSFGGAFVNAGGVTGSQFAVTLGSRVSSANGPADIPGNSFGVFDATSSYNATTVNNAAFSLGQEISGAPTISNLIPLQWSIFKDTSGGGVYLAYNDAATIKSVALADPPAVITSGATFASPYDVKASDDVVLFDKTVGAASYALMPLAANMSGGIVVLFKDVKGDAHTNLITISFTGGELCDGQHDVVIASDYGSVRIAPLPGGGGWYQTT